MDMIAEQYDMDHEALMAFEAEENQAGSLEIHDMFTFPKSRRNRTYHVMAIFGDEVHYAMVDKPEKGIYSMPITHEIVRV